MSDAIFMNQEKMIEFLGGKRLVLVVTMVPNVSLVESRPLRMYVISSLSKRGLLIATRLLAIIQTLLKYSGMGWSS